MINCDQEHCKTKGSMVYCSNFQPRYHFTRCPLYGSLRNRKYVPFPKDITDYIKKNTDKVSKERR